MTTRSDFELAREIVLQVRHRRKAGEDLRDEQILDQHPELREQLVEQLAQLRQIEQALQTVDQRGGDSVGSPLVEPPPVSRPQVSVRQTAREPLMGTLDLQRLRTTAVVQHDPDVSLISPPAAPPLPRQSADQIVPFRPTFRPPMAVIKLYHDGVRSFNHYPVMSDHFVIGRSQGDLQIPHDVRISSRHAEIQRRIDEGVYRWFLVDLDSRNGTFVRVDRAILKHDDEVMIGREPYRFFCSDSAAGLIHVSSAAGDQWRFASTAVWIGRQFPCGLRSFAQDEFVEPKHAYIQLTSTGDWVIKNLSSLNGIWYRVQEVELPWSCGFQLGEQRFGFYCPQQKSS